MIASSFRDKVAAVMARWNGNYSDRRNLADVLAEQFTPRLAKDDWTPAGYPRTEAQGPIRSV